MPLFRAAPDVEDGAPQGMRLSQFGCQAGHEQLLDAHEFLAPHLHIADGIALGFDIEAYENDDKWKILTNEWKRVIKEKRKAEKANA